MNSNIDFAVNTQNTSSIVRDSPKAQERFRDAIQEVS